MNDKTIPGCLQPLVEFLEGLTERAPLAELKRVLSNLDVCADDLREFARFQNIAYRRNLIAEGEWYELLCICWKSGQRSPIHNHAGSTCGLRVIQGCATETIFEMTVCGQVKPVASVDYPCGYVCATQDEQIHQVSNLQAPGEDLITLHIYSPPLRTMDTYSLMGAESSRYEPETHGQPVG